MNRTTINTYRSLPRHPLGVKPSGNTIFQDTTDKRASLLGSLLIFNDEIILLIITYLNARDLLQLSHTSRILYAFCHTEEIWKNLYLNNKLNISWLGSWRKTILQITQELNIQVNGTVCSDLLYRPYQCSVIDYAEIFKKLILEEEVVSHTGVSNSHTGHIMRIPEMEMTKVKFSHWINTPFILTNTDPGRWPLYCNMQYLLLNYPNEIMRQESVKWDIELYLKYFDNSDESPLYLFDPINKIIKDLSYDIPTPFTEDLFNLFQKCRPDHKWLIVGPRRSGSTFHKDPNTTSAWNTTLQGRKVWIMTPPDVIPPGVSTDITEDEVTSPIGLLEWVLSGFYNDAVRLSHTGDCLIGVTFPGECLYVPSGWWHMVINVDDNIALTENFMPLNKLSNVLSFFQFKNDQISGFHPNEVYVELEQLISELSDPSDIQFFRGELDKLQRYKDEMEDIGEIDNLKLPIYEIFTRLLKLNGYGDQLELINSKDKDKSKKQSWNSIIKQNSFSFSFDE